MYTAAVPPATTQADQVFTTLRAEILSGRIAPGAKIKINELAANLDVSLGSVREALSRLLSEGLVIAQAQRGYTVAPVSQDELTDLTNTRISIEQLCLRNAIEQGDVDWETGIVASFHRLHRIPELDPSDPAILNENWAVAHGAFHLALVAGCLSRSLLRIRSNLYYQTERYRRLSIPLGRSDRDVDAEHKALMEGVLGRNADLACGLISEHLWVTTRILLASPLLASL